MARASSTWMNVEGSEEQIKKVEHAERATKDFPIEIIG